MDTNMELQDTATEIHNLELSEKDIVLPQEEIDEVMEEAAKTQKELAAQAQKEVKEMHFNALQMLEDSMQGAQEGALKAIEEVRAESTDGTITVEQQLKIDHAELLLKNIEATRKQGGLIKFALESKINYSVAITPSLVKKEYEKLRGFMRTHKITNFNFDNAFRVMDRHSENTEIRNRVAVLYVFLRYLNYLKAQKALTRSLIYLSYTASAISSTFVGGPALKVSEAILPILHEKQKNSTKL